jgi:hypothetical protein
VGTNVQPPGGSNNILPAGHSGLTNLQRNSSMTQLATASDSHPSPGGGLGSSMGLPASPRSFSSGSLTSLVRHQVASPQLSRLEQQENQLHQHLQQTNSVTPPSQLLLQQQQQQQQRQPQSVQAQDQLPQSSQQQQAVAQLLSDAAGSQSLGMGQQAALGGGGTTVPQQVIVGLTTSTGIQQQQQALQPRVKVEQQQPDQSLQHLQQQLLMPKREIKNEDATAHQEVQHSIQRPDSVGLSPQLHQQELQLQMQRQQQPQQQMHTRLNLLQQQRLLQQQQQQQQQQQLLQSHHLQRSPLQLQQHQNELQQLHQHTTSNLQSAAQAKQPACEPGVCSRRLMQYMYHQRHRPSVSCFFVFWGILWLYL